MSTRTNPNHDGTFDVITLCEDGCGRRVEQSNITAANSTVAAMTAHSRLAAEGWDGGTCRACLLHASGWQSDRDGLRLNGGRL